MQKINNKITNAKKTPHKLIFVIVNIVRKTETMLGISNRGDSTKGIVGRLEEQNGKLRQFSY